MDVVVNDGQSLIDIAMQCHGSLDNLFLIATTNGLSITNELPAGLKLTVPEGGSTNIVKYLSDKAVKPATDITTLIKIQAGFFDEYFDATLE
jgi:hypothetical protein